MTGSAQTFGLVTVQQLDIGFRFTKRGSPGSGPSSVWLVTDRAGLEEMDLRARSLRRPLAVDLRSAVEWACQIVRSGQAPGVC